MADIYIHGTEPSEQERLAGLNRMTNAAFIQFLGVRPRSMVLEVGSGLGILGASVAQAADDVDVVGVELSAAQIAAAPARPRVTFRQGDAHALEFPDASFDLVYARYLLEHVTDPERVLREMRRVAKPGGRVAVCENDISLLRLDPLCPAFDSASSGFSGAPDSRTLSYRSSLNSTGTDRQTMSRGCTTSSAISKALGMECWPLGLSVNWT